MTSNTKDRIWQILLKDLTISAQVEAIAEVVDKELTEVLSKTMQIGELLEAVGLEIRAKEGRE